MCKNYKVKGLLIISFAWLLLFISYNTIQNRITTIFKDLDYNNLGTYSVAVIYFFFALGAFLSNKIIQKWKYYKTLICGTIVYCVFFGLCIIPSVKFQYNPPTFFFSDIFIHVVIFIGAALLGFAGGQIWVVQGSYLTAISDKDVIGRNNGIFWIIYSLSGVIGSLVTGLSYSSALFFFVLMTSISIFSPILLCFLPKVEQQKVHPSKGTRNLSQSIDQINQQNKRVLPFWPLVFNQGMLISYSAVMLSDSAAEFAKKDGHEEPNRSGSFVMLGFSIVQFFAGYSIGKVLDKCGKKIGILIFFITGMLSYGLFMIVAITQDFNALLFIAAIVSGWYEMTGRVCCTTILGGQFKERKEMAFSFYRFFNSGAASIWFFITPLFNVSGRREIYTGIFAVWLLLCSILCLTYKYQSDMIKKQNNQQSQKVSNTVNGGANLSSIQEEEPESCQNSILQDKPN